VENSEDLLLFSTVYAPHSDYNETVNQIENYVRSSMNPIRCLLFASQYDFIKRYANSAKSSNQILIEHYSPDICIGKVTKTIGRTKKRIASSHFLLFRYKESDYYILLSHEKRELFEGLLTKQIKNLYPYCTIPFFYSWEIEHILSNLVKKLPQYKIMLTKVSKKSRLRDLSSRKEKESDLIWTDLPFKEVFRTAKENDEWIEKVNFDLLSEENTQIAEGPIRVMSGLVSRDGIYRVQREFKIFIEHIIGKSIEIFQKRREQLSNRARKKEENYACKPIFIEFGEPIFKNKEKNICLADVINKFTNSACSIIHENPYMHAIITDYQDNSNYDIWVLADNNITIVPQTVCSMSSLNRFINHLSKEFQEGEILS